MFELSLSFHSKTFEKTELIILWYISENKKSFLGYLLKYVLYLVIMSRLANVIFVTLSLSKHPHIPFSHTRTHAHASTLTKCIYTHTDPAAGGSSGWLSPTDNCQSLWCSDCYLNIICVMAHDIESIFIMRQGLKWAFKLG